MTQLTKTPRKIRSSIDGDVIRKHGPVEISEATFLQYASEDAPNYNRSQIIFDAWLDERNSDELRRLALRDILQQTYDFNLGVHYAGYAAYYLIGQNFDRILIDGAGSVDALRNLLRVRPKLLGELIEEFEYNAAYEVSCHRSVPQYKRRCYDCIILILLSIVDGPTGRRLQQYLSMNYDTGWYADQLFATTTEAAQLPQWFCDDVRDRIRTVLQNTTRKLHTDPTISHDTDLTRKAYTLQRLSEYLRFNSCQTKFFPYQVPSSADIITLLRIIEANIPSKGRYLDANIVIHTLPTLPDEEIARRVAMRHVITYESDIKNQAHYVSSALRAPQGRVFLYWLYGQVHYADPTNHDVIAAIHNLIDQVHADTDTEGS